MGLFKKKKDKADGQPQPPQQDNTPYHTAQPPSNEQDHQPSKTTHSIHGLPITIYGLQQLTPSSSHTPTPSLPQICVAIHMHGRGGSAENEDWICRGIWAAAVHQDKDKVDHRGSSSHTNSKGKGKDLLVITFDARNHGHRLTDELAQKGWGVGNEQHALDLYGMILGTASDVSHLISFLPAYLFPHDDRQITTWAVTGKSLGGHCVWHVLKDDPRVSIGVSMIGMPDYERLLEYRTKQSFKVNGPPIVPDSLKRLIRLRDPPYSGFDQWGQGNPYWGKKILTLSGAQDKLVHPSFSQPFLSRLAISHPEGRTGEQNGLKIRWFDGVKHEVTEEMVQEAGRWIAMWGLN